MAAMREAIEQGNERLPPIPAVTGDITMHLPVAAGVPVLALQPLKTRTAVCRCLRGASSSTWSTSSMIGLNGPSLGAGGSLVRV